MSTPEIESMRTVVAGMRRQINHQAKLIARYRKTLKTIRVLAIVPDQEGPEKNLADIARLAIDELNGARA